MDIRYERTQLDREVEGVKTTETGMRITITETITDPAADLDPTLKRIAQAVRFLLRVDEEGGGDG